MRVFLLCKHFPQKDSYQDIRYQQGLRAKGSPPNVLPAWRYCLSNILAYGHYPKQFSGFLEISEDGLCQVLEHIKIILNESGFLLTLDSPPSVLLTHRSNTGE